MSVRRRINYEKGRAELFGYEYVKTDNRDNHGKGGKTLSAFKRAHFICWDGEGITDPTKPNVDKYDESGEWISTTEYQNYALMMNNENVVVTDIKGLSTLTCLDCIMTSTEDKRAIHVCFGASYDFNMILADLPEEDLERLHHGESVDYDCYCIEYRSRKSLTIRRYKNKHDKWRYNEKTKQWAKDYSRTITLWDVFGFFGTSFVNSLDKYFVSGNRLPEEAERFKVLIERIQEGKKLRGTFTEETLQSFVMPYCKLEVDALCELMKRLHTHLVKADLPIARWDGAGACAAALLKRENIKEHLGRNNTPKEVVIASEYAYFGGRIETLKYGNYEPVHEYDVNPAEWEYIEREDLNSAYPAETAELDSLSNGRWIHVQTTDKTKTDYVHDIGKYAVMVHPVISLYKISWYSKKGDEIICPFPWRDRKGNVFFPQLGQGWVCRPEVLVAMQKMHKKFDMHIEEAWCFVPSTDIKPFAFIKKLFEYRKLLVALGDGAEKVIKLALNSIYGKLAQSVGYNGTSKPPYHNLIYAAMITSGTRAKLLEAALQAPESIIMLATDGIYSTKRLQVEESTTKELGKWEHNRYDYMTVVASGVYWYSAEDKETSYSRGFDQYTIMRDLVINGWKEGKDFLACKTSRYVGLGSAMGLRDFTLWRTWRTVKRLLGLNMKTVVKRRIANNQVEPYNGLVQTYAAIPNELMRIVDETELPFKSPYAMSHKFKFQWDEDANERDDIVDGVHIREYLQEVANSKA